MLSIIIPMLNEAKALPSTLAALADQTSNIELVLVDGGSSDQSVAIALQEDVKVLSSTAGRARQMNVGAAYANGEYLLFLHADTRLPAHFESLISTALAQHQWGRFDVAISGQHPMLKIISFMMNWRSRWSGIATGDQALFMRRTAFKAVGGFPEQDLMEDIALSQRLKCVGQPACLRQKVQTSGRRWEQNGVWRTIWLMWRLRFAYWCGECPSQLARRYR
ncbi:TIGR04283 family arsenosugar biosynthesis glycosyltransferase [Oceanisphaera sp. IT1-181]|uniref:TIGR04283 family arsenosugar biosynthesis glycosyltransferase n=1 Tax=Oceanisphaera sp. IT1-181 TaxID=3081199 RepID=UPI0029CA1993|nr:TIGR04283 family arsenosugar biosynthesis glycosyltransferase [Oceanisphaera sp. IT1-181]